MLFVYFGSLFIVIIKKIWNLWVIFFILALRNVQMWFDYLLKYFTLGNPKFNHLCAALNNGKCLFHFISQVNRALLQTIHYFWFFQLFKIAFSPFYRIKWISIHGGILSCGMWLGKYPDKLNLDNFLTAISHQT